MNMHDSKYKYYDTPMVHMASSDVKTKLITRTDSHKLSSDPDVIPSIRIGTSVPAMEVLRIDALIEQGHYKSRSEFLNAASKAELRRCVKDEILWKKIDNV